MVKSHTKLKKVQIYFVVASLERNLKPCYYYHRHRRIKEERIQRYCPCCYQWLIQAVLPRNCKNTHILDVSYKVQQHVLRTEHFVLNFNTLFICVCVIFFWGGGGSFPVTIYTIIHPFGMLTWKLDVIWYVFLLSPVAKREKVGSNTFCFVFLCV